MTSGFGWRSGRAGQCIDEGLRHLRRERPGPGTDENPLVPKTPAQGGQCVGEGRSELGRVPRHRRPGWLGAVDLQVPKPDGAVEPEGCGQGALGSAATTPTTVCSAPPVGAWRSSGRRWSRSCCSGFAPPAALNLIFAMSVSGQGWMRTPVGFCSDPVSRTAIRRCFARRGRGPRWAGGRRRVGPTA